MTALKIAPKTFSMTCVNCGSNDWENVDGARMKPAGMHICTPCGNVSYPEKYKSADEIKKHYRKAYRAPPTSNNFFTGQRKIYFHNAFLDSVFAEWEKQGLKTPKIFEVGAAYGLVLRWLKTIFPDAEIGGTEWTTSYKRVAKNEFSIELGDDFDETKKHDLIISYKVAEHQLDVDKELRKYAEGLSDNGLLYISVPTWFDSATNFGLSGFDLEYYYDPNHINVWTREHFESILERAGFEIIKKDYVMYDSTYLCKRNDANREKPVYKIDSEKIKERMARIKHANICFQQNKYKEAVETYPDYPTAWISWAEMERKNLFKEGKIQSFIDEMLKACPTSVDVVVSAADLLMRAEQYDAALKMCEKALKLKPENTPSFGHMINIYRELALRARNQQDKEQEVDYWKQLIIVAKHLQNVSTQHYAQAIDYIYMANAQID